MSEPFVILLGLTGSGKSTLVNRCNPSTTAKIGTSLNSCTTKVTPYKCLNSESSPFVLVDTPGFDNSRSLSDHDIMQEIIRWLNTTYVQRARTRVVCGILLLDDPLDRQKRGGRIVEALRHALPDRIGGIRSVQGRDATYRDVEATLQAGIHPVELILPLRQIASSLSRYNGGVEPKKKKPWWRILN